jgi:hypothetical protein
MVELVRILGGFGVDPGIGIEDFLTVLDFEDAIRLGGRERNVSYYSSFAADIATSMRRMQAAPEFWAAVVELIETCETIISLNWDTLVEIQTRAIGRSVCYVGSPGQNDKRILKPHGSIDWYRSATVGDLSAHDHFAAIFRGHVRYRPFSEEKDFFGVPQEFADLFNRVSPVIVAPTHIKAVPGGPLRKIWKDTYHALERASDVIVIGYSMPESDYLIRSMLQRAIRYQQILNFENAPRIVVVNPDERGTVATRFSEIFGSDFELIRRRFSDVRLTRFNDRRHLRDQPTSTGGE